MKSIFYISETYPKPNVDLFRWGDVSFSIKRVVELECGLDRVRLLLYGRSVC